MMYDGLSSGFSNTLDSEKPNAYLRMIPCYAIEGTDSLGFVIYFFLLDGPI